MLNTIQEALEDLKKGKVIIVVDDENRENEGDFICSSEKVTPEIINFMATHGRGLICCSINRQIANKLNLKPMEPSTNTSLYETPFTVSVDLIGAGVTTGISATDRTKTILRLIDQNSQPNDFARPGHIFPLVAQDEGVLKRPGHTEASVDLARLAGHKPSGVIVEICSQDGSMARLPELREIAKKWNLKMISIADLIKFRRSGVIYNPQNTKESTRSDESQVVMEKSNKTKTPKIKDFDTLEGVVKKTLKPTFSSQITLPTKYGEFQMQIIKDFESGLEHSIVWKGNPEEKNFKIRIHSSCQTGDIFHSQKCDCGEQLDETLKLIQKTNSGMVIYLQQEGRGIGLFNKIEAYKLQEMGRNTIEANLELGFLDDQRSYEIIKEIAKNYNFSEINLITNNPLKIDSLKNLGIKVNQRIPILIPANPKNENYLEVKKNQMGHLL